jgi:hypothetical protein
MWSESHTGATSTAAEAPSAHRPGPIGHENNQSLTYAEPQPPLSPT